jgi:hypothetical protein
MTGHVSYPFRRLGDGRSAVKVAAVRLDLFRPTGAAVVRA